jgi:hypothetical protein
MSDQIQCYSQRYGEHTLSYASVQPKMSYFSTEHGFISYKKICFFSKTFSVSVLGDPVCDDKHLRGLLNQFLHAYPRACFFQVNTHTKYILDSFRFKHHCMGVDNTLALKHFSPTWRSHFSLKRHYNKAVRERVIIVSFQRKVRSPCRRKVF